MMPSPYDALQKQGISLPAAATPAAAYLPWVRSGELIFLSGHIAKRNGQVWCGQLGRDMDTAQGAQAARAVAIDLLGTLHAATGDLQRVRRIVKLTGLVNSSAHYTEQHLVINGASELLADILGAQTGSHARSAFGAAQLPLGACVEIELVAQVQNP